MLKIASYEGNLMIEFVRLYNEKIKSSGYKLSTLRDIVKLATSIEMKRNVGYSDINEVFTRLIGYLGEAECDSDVYLHTLRLARCAA